jgi:hypothetical protein
MGKPECRVPGCGGTEFLRQHENFVFADDALANAVVLFDRRSDRRSMTSQLRRARH